MNKKIFAVILFVIVAVAITILVRSHNSQLILQGEVEAPYVSIASKAKGRVATIDVKRGDNVKVGDVLITLVSPELASEVKAAQAAQDQAQAQLDLSEHGTREESLRYYQALLAQTKVNYDNAVKEYDRNASISSKGYVSQSALDDSLKARDAAYQQVLSAQANLDQALHGDRTEQKSIYKAQLQQAEEKLIQLMIQYDDLNVKSPVDGEVGAIPAEVGELFSAQSPLITVIRLSDSYFIFNIREDILATIHKDDLVTLKVPALGDQNVEAKIGYIAAMGDFATKRATRATGDFDLKTFEVRLYPTKPIENLRAGMSVLWQQEH